MAGSNFSNNIQCGVIFFVRGKNDFVICRVVLDEKAFDIFAQVGFRSVHGLEQRNRRKRLGFSRNALLFTSFAVKFCGANERKNQKNGGRRNSHEPKYKQSEAKVMDPSAHLALLPGDLFTGGARGQIAGGRNMPEISDCIFG